MTAEQVQRQADLLIEFMRADHEDDKNTPGPYEQGANLRAPLCWMCTTFGREHDCPCDYDMRT